MKSKYAALLNDLDAMQQSHAYAARKHVLAEAERTIVALEKEVKELQEKVQELELDMELRMSDDKVRGYE